MTNFNNSSEPTSSPARPNDVLTHGGLFARVPHELLLDGLEPTSVALYAHLMRYADWRTGEAHPKRQTLATLLGYTTVKPVDRALKELREAGWVDVFPRWRRYEGGQQEVAYEARPGFTQTSNGYVLYAEKNGGAAPAEGGRGSREGTPGGSGRVPQGVPEGYTNDNQLINNQKNKGVTAPGPLRGARAEGEAHKIFSSESDSQSLAASRPRDERAARRACPVCDEFGNRLKDKRGVIVQVRCHHADEDALEHAEALEATAAGSEA